MCGTEFRTGKDGHLDLTAWNSMRHTIAGQRRILTELPPRAKSLLCSTRLHKFVQLHRYMFFNVFWLAYYQLS